MSYVNTPHPGSQEWEDEVAGALRQVALDAEIKAELDRVRRGGVAAAPTWVPVDLGSVCEEQLMPTIGVRADGKALLYAGKVHVLYGDSYAGKTWLALTIASQAIEAGKRALFLDFEDDERGFVSRLRALGVPEHRYTPGPRQRFFYVRPGGSLNTELDRANFEALLGKQWDLVTIDGVTESMVLEDLSFLYGHDVAVWLAMLPKRFAEATGAAVLCIDHVVKDVDKRNGSPIGSERKVSGLSGASFVIAATDPFIDGGIGCATVRVGKDRHGQVNRHGVDYDDKTRTWLIAHFELDSTAKGVSVARITTPSAPPVGEDEDERAEKLRRYSCWFMEQISRWFEDVVPQGESRSKEAVIAAMCQERKEAGKKQNRNYWRDAVTNLLTEGYLKAPEHSLGRSYDLTLVKPYRQVDDPCSDNFGSSAFVAPLGAGPGNESEQSESSE
jgi:hypothetical protein